MPSCHAVHALTAEALPMAQRWPVAVQCLYRMLLLLLELLYRIMRSFGQRIETMVCEMLRCNGTVSDVTRAKVVVVLLHHLGGRGSAVRVEKSG